MALMKLSLTYSAYREMEQIPGGPLRQIGEAIGREVRFEELTYEQALVEMEPSMGEYAAWYLDGIAPLVDHPQPALPTVEQLSGRPATTFAQWAARHAAYFR